MIKSHNIENYITVLVRDVKLFEDELSKLDDKITGKISNIESTKHSFEKEVLKLKGEIHDMIYLISGLSHSYKPFKDAMSKFELKISDRVSSIETISSNYGNELIDLKYEILSDIIGLENKSHLHLDEFLTRVSNASGK